MGLLPLCLLLLPFPWGGGVVSMKGELVWTFFWTELLGKGKRFLKKRRRLLLGMEAWRVQRELLLPSILSRLFISYFDIKHGGSSMRYLKRDL